MTPAIMVFWRELRLPCNPLFGNPPNKEESTTDNVVDIVDHLNGMHYKSVCKWPVTG